MKSIRSLFHPSYKIYATHKGFLFSVLFSFVLLFVSLIVSFYAGTYATERASNSVTDIILNAIPVFDVDFIFTWGAIVFWLFVIFICFTMPQRIPFTLKSISLFVIIRSIFISLTHLGPFPTHVAIDPSYILSKFTFGGDLFFSGHTGLPFLLALIFWNTKSLRYFFITSSVVFGVIVLLGHLHYSIDVLAAFFITFSIYHIAERWFKKDKVLFDDGLPEGVSSVVAPQV